MGEKRTSNCLPIAVAEQVSVYRDRCKQGCLSHGLGEKLLVDCLGFSETAPVMGVQDLEM